jgi:Tfp pilus assembly protein PilO
LLGFVMLMEAISVIGFYSHQKSVLDALQAQYTAHQTELGQAQQLGAQSATLQTKLLADQVQLGHLEKALSTKEYVPTLLTQLQQLATETHNTILTLKPVAPPPGPAQPQPAQQGNQANQNGTQSNGQTASGSSPAQVAYDNIQVELDIQGSYRNVMGFLMRLTEFPKIIEVNKFQVSSQGAAPGPSGAQGDSMITANIGFLAYILKGN